MGAKGSGPSRNAERAARDQQIVALRDEGVTLEEIGQKFGITRERARQIVEKANGTGAEELRARRRQQRDEADRALAAVIRQDILDHPGSRKADVAERLGLDARTVSRLLPADVAALVVEDNRNAGVRTWTDEAILDAMRSAATYEYPLSGSAYQRLVDIGEINGPSSALLHRRFGSWTRACELAGIEPDRLPHDGYQSRWTDADLLNYVAAYLRAPGSRGTYAGYLEWSRTTSDAPSGPSLRNRLGGWTEIKRRALREQSTPGEGAVE